MKKFEVYSSNYIPAKSDFWVKNNYEIFSNFCFSPKEDKIIFSGVKSCQKSFLIPNAQLWNIFKYHIYWAPLRSKCEYISAQNISRQRIEDRGKLVKIPAEYPRGVFCHSYFYIISRWLQKFEILSFDCKKPVITNFCIVRLKIFCKRLQNWKDSGKILF